MVAGAASLRADAARNRELILAAAREVFAESGLDVSMRQIALRAGVGEPTLRRRFGSKEELVAEAFEDKVGAYADLANAALEAPDPAAGFRGFLEKVTAMQLVDRGFADVLTMTFPPTMRCEQHRRRSYEAIERLIAKAKDAGVLRRDFVAEDIVLVLLAHAGVVGGAGKLAGSFSARLLAFLFEGFGLNAGDALPPAPSAAQVYRALLRLHDDKKQG
ncbi:helix-turn-helix domain-containing protein [Saccharomonospora sp. NPDC046836]|uniref:TetR/AcrR family transcriptional regulator n=1 Tax=Saccharomonospora sp. NPDC046836 TaxID=3156921 RepID=UPI0033D0A496